MLSNLWKRIKNNRDVDPMAYAASDIWIKGEIAASFDFHIHDHARVIQTETLVVEFRGDWGRTPELRITANGERVFDASKPARRIYVQVFRRGSWLVELEQLWRVAETKARIQAHIEHRQNFDPI